MGLIDCRLVAIVTVIWVPLLIPIHIIFRLQDRVLDYYSHQWENHRLLVGEDTLGFTKSLSEPLQNEISLFLVRGNVCVSDAPGLRVQRSRYMFGCVAQHTVVVVLHCSLDIFG